MILCDDIIKYLKRDLNDGEHTKAPKNSQSYQTLSVHDFAKLLE
jgi:hypothetical protein